MLAFRSAAVCLVLLLLASSALAETKLAVRYEEGATYKEKESVSTNQTLTLGGQPQVTAAETTLTSETKVGKRTDQGELTIESTYTDVVSSMTLPGNKKVSYNSITGEGTTDDPNYQIVLDILKGIKGSTYTVVLDKDNRVKSISGLKPEGGVSPDDVKLAMQQAIDRYPQEALEPGAEWDREIIAPLGAGQIFTIQRKYKYVGPEVRSTVTSTQKLEKITATTSDVKYSIRPGGALPGTVSKSDLKVASAESTLYFDPAKGRTVSAHDKLHVTGGLAFSIMNMEFSGDLDLTMEVKAEEVK